MRIIALIYFLNLCFATCKAQVYFNKVYDDTSHSGETATNVLLLDDGSLFIPSVFIPSQGDFSAGYGFRKIDISGQEIFQTEIISPQSGIIYSGTSESIIETNDGGYLQATALNHGTVIKITSNLELDWILTFDSLNSFYRPLELANGNFFVCGYTYETNHINLFWISPEGEVLYHTFANPYPQGNFYNILRAEELANGDLLLCGFDVVGWDSNQLLIRIDSFGDLVWKRKLSYDFQDWTPYTIIDSDTMATAVFGHIDYVLNPDDIARENFHGRLGTMQVDLDTGDTSDVILCEPEMMYYWLTDFTKTPDNGYAALGWASQPNQGINYSFILKLDENRQQEWYKTYLHEPFNEDSTQIAQAWDFEVTADSGFVVAGHWDDLEMLGKQMPWVFKTDACGDLVWSNCGMSDVAEELRNSKQQTFNIYPNPSNTVLNITSDHEFESITLRNPVRQVVHHVQLNNRTLQSQVDLSALARGVYLVEVCFGQAVVVAQRLVVE